MALSYKTPGVYLEEIVKLPPSVASVETAIPCFFGVTQDATELTALDLVGVGKKIGSLADYEFYFGLAAPVTASVTVHQNVPSEASVSSYTDNMYYSVKHYFDNGGGPCYIFSVGTVRANVDVNTYKNALLQLDLLDEVTLILVPDLIALNNADRYYDVFNGALQKASSLQDKFVIIDVNREYTGTKVSAENSKNVFRNTISNNIDAIKYGAAYFPWLETTYSYDLNSAVINLTFSDDVLATNPAASLLNKTDYNLAKELYTINTVIQLFSGNYFNDISTDRFASKIADISNQVAQLLPWFKTDGQTLTSTAQTLTNQVSVQAAAALAGAQASFNYADTAAGEKTALLTLLQNKILTDFGTIPQATRDALAANGVNTAPFATFQTSYLAKIAPFFNSALEASMKDAFNNIPLLLPPSPAIAGIYATVDRTRGVWKAPANVSLISVSQPEVFLSDLDQEDFNVDSNNGKSINCIRQFVGRGNLVWGARTLAGNDNEWRYINVRRFFNMVEESCRNASRQFVFEPNDANTWTRVKGMIDNYLTNLWRDGALQGAKPADAFYTAVGLNQTMTQDDLNNGLLIVEIGLAVVRPAEFIILRFSHKLAVS